MTQPAFIYARYSAAEQGRGTSLVRQFENGRDYAEAKGWLLDADREISDRGKSAFHGANRAPGGALFEFEQRVRKGYYRNGAVFVTEHLDRISRQGWKPVYDFIELCVSNGVSVATIDGDRFYEADREIEPMVVMEVIWKAQGAKDESKKKSDRGLKNWELKVRAIENGDRAARIGLPPGWMERVKKTNAPVLNEHRTAVLNEIYQLYVDGYGLPKIVSLLNGRGEPSWGVGKKNRGQGWNTAYLHKLLTNRAVLGEYVPMSRTHQGINETGKGIRIPDHYPQAIPAELWEQAQQVRGQRRFTGGPTEGVINNLFSGVAFCGSCGSAMYFEGRQRAGRETRYKGRDGTQRTFKAATSISYLRCNDNRRHHECGNSTTFRYEALEPAVLDAVLAVTIDDTAFTVPDEVAALSANVAERERAIQDKRHNLDQIVEALGEQFIRALATKAQEIEGELDRDETDLQTMREELARLRGSADPEQQLARIRELKASIDAEDRDARYAARARVKQALASLCRIDCGADGIATARLLNGLMAWRFDRRGQPVGTPVDLRNRLDLHRGLPGPRQITDDVLRRMEQPERVPVDPSEQRWKYPAKPLERTDR